MFLCLKLTCVQRECSTTDPVPFDPRDWQQIKEALCGFSCPLFPRNQAFSLLQNQVERAWPRNCEATHVQGILALNQTHSCIVALNKSLTTTIRNFFNFIPQCVDLFR